MVGFEVDDRRSYRLLGAPVRGVVVTGEEREDGVGLTDEVPGGGVVPLAQARCELLKLLPVPGGARVVTRKTGPSWESEGVPVGADRCRRSYAFVMSELAATFVPVEEYLAWGERDRRYEYVDGAVFAMSGGTWRHSRLASELNRLLGNASVGGSCKVNTADLRIQVTRTRYYYPDVSVSCEQGDEMRTTETAPCLIVEVVSPSTEQTDRREKLVAYLTVASLRHYLIVTQDEPRIDHYSRSADGTWAFQVCGPGDSLNVTCPSATIELDSLYGAL